MKAGKDRALKKFSYWLDQIFPLLDLLTRMHMWRPCGCPWCVGPPVTEGEGDRPPSPQLYSEKSSET